MAATFYMVLQSVGLHSPGDIISISQENIAAGVNVSSLLASGVIRLATGPEAASPRAQAAQFPAAGMLLKTLTHYGTPTNGTGGTFAGQALPGTILTDLSSGAMYTNTGTRDSPVWSLNASTPNPLTSTVHDQGGAVFNVMAYGAVGDGVTLDDAAIAACLVAANAQSPGGARIVFQPGYTYLHQAPIVPFAGQLLVGYGAVLKRPNQVSSAFSGTITAGGLTITGITSTAGFQVGQNISYLSGATFDNSVYTISAVTSSSITVTGSSLGTSVTGGTVFTALPQIKCLYDNQGVIGLTLDGNSANNTVGPSWHSQAEIQCVNNSMLGFTVRDCVLKNCACEGMILAGIGGTVTNNRILTAFGDGIHMAGCDRYRITHNYVNNTNTGNSQHGPQAAIVYSAGNPNCVVSQNVVDTTGPADGTNAYGIALTIDSSEDGGVCADNVITNAANASIFWWGASNQLSKAYEISGNRCYNGANVAMELGLVTSPAYPSGYRLLTVHDNYVEGSVKVQNLWLSDIHDNIFTQAGNHGSGQIPLQVSGAGLRIHDNLLIGGFQSVALNAATTTIDVDFCHNTLIDGYNQGLVLAAAMGSSTRIHGNRIRGTVGNIAAGWTGIYVNANNGVLIDGNDVQTNQTTATPINVKGGGVAAGATGAILTGNQVRGATVSITLAAAGANHLLTNNLITGTIADSSTGSTISGTVTIV